MVSIKEATQRAMAFAREALGEQRATDLRLEEIESATVRGKDAWVITLSILASEQTLGSVGSPFGAMQREYKTFTVLKNDGEVRSMKIRELASR